MRFDIDESEQFLVGLRGLALDPDDALRLGTDLTGDVPQSSSRTAHRCGVTGIVWMISPVVVRPAPGPRSTDTSRQ